MRQEPWPGDIHRNRADIIPTIPDPEGIYWAVIDLARKVRKGDSFPILNSEINDSLITWIGADILYDDTQSSFMIGGTISLAQAPVQPRESGTPEVVKKLAKYLAESSGLSEELRVEVKTVKKGLPREFDIHFVVDPEEGEDYIVRWHVFSGTDKVENQISVYLQQELFLDSLTSPFEGEEERIRNFTVILKDYARALAIVVEGLYWITETDYEPPSKKFVFEVNSEEDDPEPWL